VITRLLEKNGPSVRDIKRLNVIEISLWEIDHRAAAKMVKNCLAEVRKIFEIQAIRSGLQESDPLWLIRKHFPDRRARVPPNLPSKSGSMTGYLHLAPTS
jgi:phosphoenolpyruvate carboxylase